MSHEVLMPQLGMAQDSATIDRWNKSVGDSIAVGEILLEVETDKAVMEIESRHDGFIAEILREAGSEVPVGDVIAKIAEATDSFEASPGSSVLQSTQQAVAEPVDQRSETVSNSLTASNAIGTVQQSVPDQNKRSSRTDGVLASPKARRLAYERGLDLKNMIASGASQPVYAADVLAATQNTTNRVNAMSLLQANANLAEFNELLEWNSGVNGSGTKIADQQTWAAFCYSAQPDTRFNTPLIVRVTDHLDVSRFWCVSARGLSSAVEKDSAARWDLDILDLTQTAIVSHTPATAFENTTLVLCSGTSGEVMDISLNLFYAPGSLTTTHAAGWLQGISARCSNPLIQLI